MPRFEYKVIPAPKKGNRVKGVRGADLRFASALQDIMNEYGDQGWDYLRTDTLPCEERQGLTGKNTVFQNMLVFRRELSAPNGHMPREQATDTPDDGNDQSASDVIATPIIENPADTPKPGELGGFTKDTA